MRHVVPSHCRKFLQRSGKDHSILLVLPSGIFHYRFIVDGEWRYIPDLPFEADEIGRVCNLLDVHVYVLLLLHLASIFSSSLLSLSHSQDHSGGGCKKGGYVLKHANQTCSCDKEQERQRLTRKCYASMYMGYL